MKVSEASEQTKLFEWAMIRAKQCPELWFLHAIPNGGTRHKAEAVRLKQQGVKAGVSDLFMPVARHNYHGLYIELKSVGGKLSASQSEWISRVSEQGYCAVVAYGFDEAKNFLEWYLGLCV